MIGRPPARARSNLRRLFRGLEALYGSDTGLDPWDLVTTDVPGAARETLLLRQRDDTLEVALALDAEVLARFEDTAPERALDLAHLGHTLPVIEGLSHLLLVAESARCERPVSGLELEAQAEVDKLAVHVLHTWPPSPGEFRALVDRLYYRFDLHADLAPDLRARYLTANRLALAFSRRLADLTRARRLDGLRRTLRAFWRASLSGKRALAA